MRRYSGFTIVELITAIVLVSLLAFVFIPRHPVESINTAGLSDQLLADIRYAQALSMTRGQRYCVLFTASTYQLRSGDTCTTPINHPATGSSSPVGLNGGTLSLANLPNNYVAFNGKGIPYTDGTTTLAADATVTLAFAGNTRTITISTQTGRSIAQ